MRKAALLPVIVVSLLVLPAFAHHATGEGYDRSNPITLNGTFTKLEWQNPHVYFFVEVTEQNGQRKTWRIDADSPSKVAGKGLSKEMIRVGETVTFVTFPFARQDRPPIAWAQRISFADGRSFILTD